MPSVPFLQRSFQYRMHVVEAATRFSTGKLLFAKMLAVGMGDLVLIGGTFLITLEETTLKPMEAAVYLMTPFLLLGSIGLYLIGYVSIEQYVTGSSAAAFVVLAVVFGMREICPWIFEEMYLYGWAGLCVILTVVCAGQICHMIQHPPMLEVHTSFE